MFIPNYNNPMIRECNKCGKMKVAVSSMDEWNNWAGAPLPDICHDCLSEINDEEKENDLLDGGVKLILDTYYKRDIKISFTYDKKKYEHYYTAMMLSNRKQMYEKIKDCEIEMERSGLKKIQIKFMSDFQEMNDSEISFCMNAPEETRIDHISSYHGNVAPVLPLVLKNYANARSTIRFPKSLKTSLKIAILMFHCFAVVLWSFYMVDHIGTISWKTFAIAALLLLSIFNAVNTFNDLKD